MPEKTDMIQVLLDEIRELRKDFQEFRGDVLLEQGKQQGSHKTMAAVVSMAVSAAIAILSRWLFKT